MNLNLGLLPLRPRPDSHARMEQDRDVTSYRSICERHENAFRAPEKSEMRTSLTGHAFSRCAACPLEVSIMAKPMREKTVTITNGAASVRIKRDAQGIPHVEAGTLNDALLGLG